MTEKFRSIVVAQQGRVATVRLNQPDSLNALNSELMIEVVAAFAAIDNDPGIAVSILTGEGRAFAAGADIKEMRPQGFADMYVGDFFAGWDRFAAHRKPVIAAVNGFALGGGCELALMCDLIIASEQAKFGQPEIKLGVTPGMGGSQRLTRIIGKARAMDMVLTGRMVDADEAGRWGICSRVIPHDALLTEAQQIAETIAGYSIPSVLAAREMVAVAQELSTTEGVRFERRLFHALFATDDQAEGMQAFIDKRDPDFSDS